MTRWTAAALLLAHASGAFGDDSPIGPLGLLGSPSAIESFLPTQLLDSPNAGDDTFVKIRVGGMFVTADGEVTSGDIIAGSTNVLDLEDTLGQDTDDFSPIGSLTVAIPVIDLSIEAGFVGDYTFDGTTTQSISFNDEQFTGTIDSEEQLTIYELNVLYELLEVKFVTVYLGLGARVIDAEAEITGEVSGMMQTEREDLILPIPVGVIGANLDLGANFAIRGQLAGLYAGDYGTVIDAEAEIGYDFNRFFGLFVGYRFMNVTSEEFDLEVDATLQGIYAGAEVRF